VICYGLEFAVEGRKLEQKAHAINACRKLGRSNGAARSQMADSRNTQASRNCRRCRGDNVTRNATPDDFAAKLYV
jgi:hypothetical protein